MLFAKTGKALSRLNEMFKKQEIQKYWAIVKNPPAEPSDKLEHYLVRNENRTNRMLTTVKKALQKAILYYKTLAKAENYTLLEINLETGRHHQIRCQLAKIGSPIKGDLKYGFQRSNPNGGISLHARSVSLCIRNKENIHRSACSARKIVGRYYQRIVI